MSRELRLLRGLKRLSFLYQCKRDGSWCPRGQNHCCKECGEHGGYLEYLEPEDLQEYQKALIEGSFLGDDGCRLPVHLRSVTCITHLCRQSKKEMPSDLVIGLQALKEVMLDLESAIGKEMNAL